MNPIIVSLTTTFTTTNVSRGPLKGIPITESEGGSSNAHAKTTSTFYPKDKGYVILIEQSYEEKKNLQAAEFERQKKINNILRKRENGPPGLNKCDLNKH